MLAEPEDVDSAKVEVKDKSRKSPKNNEVPVDLGADSKNAATDFNESFGDVDGMADKLDEVNNHESHRTRDGRDIKYSS